jgi:hypothetical protein
LVLDNQTDIILSGLGYVTIMKLNMPKEIYEIYYLNDYEEVKDFVIYYIPTSFDKTKITNTNTEIENITIFNTSIEFKPFKFGLKTYNEEIIKNSIKEADTKAGKTTSSTSSITASDINNFLNIFKANKNSILRYVRLMLIAPFIKLHANTNLTPSSKISIDLLDLFTPNKYFNSDITPYLPSGEESSIFIMMGNNIFNPLQQNSGGNTYVPPTNSSISIRIAPTAPADTTDTDIIKLYSDENFTGSVQNFNIRSATNKNNNTYKLSVYDSSSGSPPPKSYKIIQPLNDETYFSNYKYTTSLNYVYTDNSQFNIDMPPINNVSTIPSTMDGNLLDGTQITRTLKNIFVYIETTPANTTSSM